MGTLKWKVGAVLVACVVGSGGWLYTEQLSDEHEAIVANQVEVVKTSQNIASGVPLSKSLITTEKVPRKFLPPNPLLESELNIYLGTPLAVNVEEGAMILTTDFSVADRGTLPGSTVPSPRVIKTASLKISADSPSNAGQAALASVAKAGGYIVSSDIYVSKDKQSFSMVARVPAEVFEDVVFGMNELGDPIERRIRGAGVTSDVQRLEREIGNTKFLVEGLRFASVNPKPKKTSKIEIIRGGETIKTTSVEETEEKETAADLATAQKDLADLEGDLVEIEQKSALSTISLEISEPFEASPAPEEPTFGEELVSEFQDSTKSVVKAFFATVVFAVSAIPYLFGLSPFALAFVIAWRRRRRAS